MQSKIVLNKSSKSDSTPGYYSSDNKELNKRLAMLKKHQVNFKRKSMSK